MSTRTSQVLDRFPAHLDAARPGKLLWDVVDALSHPFDVLSADLAAVRRAHRLGHADTTTDVGLLAGLHDIDGAELIGASLRMAALREHIAALAAGGAEAEANAEALLDLLGVGGAAPRWAPFAPEGPPPALSQARGPLLAAASELTRYGVLVDLLRKRVRTLCQLHARGNGGARTLIAAAANALDLDPVQWFASDDRYWHAAQCRDRLRLKRVLADGSTEELPWLPSPVVIEENPLRREEYKRGPTRHAELFSILRRGFADQPLEVAITGIGARTVGPMLTNRDEGRGIGFAGVVPDGSVLVMSAEGRATLDGTDVTSYCFAWQGGVFTDSPTDRRGFRFAGTSPGERDATFAKPAPTDGLSREAGFPHGGASFEPVPVYPGETRLAFFVREAHFALHDADAPSGVLAVPPKPTSAVYDASVFSVPPTEAASRTPAASLDFAWRDHEAFALQMWIPARFSALGSGGPSMADRVRTALERHRAAGVDVRVHFIDDGWILGQGELLPGDPLDPIAAVRGATRLTGGVDGGA